MKKYIVVLVLLLVLFLSLLFMNIVKSNKVESFESSNSVAIITAIYGNYDTIKEQNINNKEKVDWYCFTDNKEASSNQWIIVNTPYHISDPNNHDNYENSYSNVKDKTYNMMCAKYYKLQSHKIDILKKYDYIIWIDGSITLQPDFINNVFHNIISQNYNLVNFKHSVRNNIKDELDESKKMEKYKHQILTKQYSEYIDDGFTDNVGLFENTIIIRKIISKINNVFDLWWLHNKKYTYQDQISYPYVLWKMNVTPDYIINENVFNNSIYSYVDFNFMQNH